VAPRPAPQPASRWTSGVGTHPRLKRDGRKRGDRAGDRRGADGRARGRGRRRVAVPVGAPTDVGGRRERATGRCAWAHSLSDAPLRQEGVREIGEAYFKLRTYLQTR